MNNEQKPQKPNSKIKHYIKIALVVLLCVALFVMVTLFYVYHKLSSNKQISTVLKAQISKALNMQVDFEEMAIGLYGFNLKKAFIAGQKDNLQFDVRVEDIFARPNFLRLLSRKLELDTFRLASATINITALEPQSLLTTDDAEAKQETQPTDTSTEIEDPKKTYSLDLSSFEIPFNTVIFKNVNISYHLDETTYSTSISSATIGKSIITASIPFALNLSIASSATLDLKGKLWAPDNLNANVTLIVHDFTLIKDFIDEEFQHYFQLADSVVLTFDLSYNNEQKLSLQNLSLKVLPHIELVGAVDIREFSPLSIQTDAKLLPLSIKPLMPVLKDLIPEDIGLDIKDGHLFANANFDYTNNELKNVNVDLFADSISAKTAYLASDISLKKIHAKYDGNIIDIENISVESSKSTISLSNSKLQVAPLSFSAQAKAKLDLKQIKKDITHLLPEESKDFSTEGEIAFNGNLKYESDLASIDGILTSKQLNLAEKIHNTRLQLKDINIQLQKLVLPDKGSIKIQNLLLSALGTNLSLKGSISKPTNPVFDLKATGKINIKEIYPITQNFIELPFAQEQLAGTINLDLALKGSIDDPKPEGKLELVDISADLTQMGIKVDKINATAKADISKLIIDNLSADLIGGQLNISGSLKDFQNPSLDLKGKMTNMDLSQIRTILLTNLEEMPREVDFSGIAQAEVNLQGSILEPQISGEAGLTKTSFYHPAIFKQLEQINGSVTFSDKGFVAKKIVAHWGKSKAELTGSVNDWENFNSDLKISLVAIDLDDATSFFLKDTGYIIKGTGTGEGKVTGPIEEIKLTSTLNIASGSFSVPVTEKQDTFRFPFKDFKADLEYYDTVFDLTSARLSLFDGEVSGSARAFIASDPIFFEFDTKIDSLRTEGFLAANTAYPDAITGSIVGNFTASGTTTDLTSLGGHAFISLLDGAYNSPPLMEKISKQIAMPELAKGKISTLAGKYDIEDGKVFAKDMLIYTNDGEISFDGYFSFDCEIKATSEFRLNRETALKDSTLKQLIGSQNYLALPMKISGTLTSPSVSIPLQQMISEAATKKAKTSIEEKAKEAISNLLKKKDKKQEPEEVQKEAVSSDSAATEQKETTEEKSSTTQKVEEKLKDLGKGIKKLFKK